MGTTPGIQAKPRRKIGLRAAVIFLIYTFFTPLIPFLASGDWDWPQAWTFYVLSVGVILGSRVLLLRIQPDLLGERAQMASGEGVKGWDRVLVPLVALVGPLSALAAAGLDRRWNWSPALPPALTWAALVVVVLAYAWSTWALLANAYFSAFVRIQKDRSQKVITSGPYRFVRHPAYAGGLLSGLATPVLLGSLWALLPALLPAGALVVRTALEDRTLQEELPGYTDYARRTRFRLIPGIW